MNALPLLLVISVLVPSGLAFAEPPAESARDMEQMDFAQGLMERQMYDMAVTEYEKFIAQYPQSPYLEEAHLAIGESYFLAKDFTKARESFLRFKQDFPQSDKLPAAILRIAQINIDQGQPEQALSELSSVNMAQMAQGEVLQGYYYYSGKAHRAKGDGALALDFFQKAADVQGTVSFTSFAREESGDLFAGRGQYKEALQEYQKALDSEADRNRQAFLAHKMAETEFAAGEYTAAAGDFKRVLQEYADSEISNDALLNLLLALFNAGTFEQVVSEYQANAGRLKPENEYFDIYFVAAKALGELNRAEESSALLDQILAFPNLSPEHKHKAVLQKASDFLRAKHYQEAVGLLESEPAGQGTGADQRLFLLAQGYFGLGNFGRAGEFYQSLLANYGASVWAKSAQLGLAHTQREAGNLLEARRNFLEYYQAGSDDQLKSEALYWAAAMEFNINQTGEAAGHAREYINKYPQGNYFELALIVAANAMAKNKESDQAVALLQEHLNIPDRIKNPAAAYFLLGYNQQLLGRMDEALGSYAKVAPDQEGSRFYSSALKNAAAIYVGQGKGDQAAALFDRLLSEFDQNFLEFKTYRWLCEQYLSQKKYPDVLRVAAKAKAFYPQEDPRFMAYALAEAYQGSGDCGKALEQYNTVLNEPLRDTLAGASRIGKGLCLMEFGQFGQASEQFQKAIEENPDDHTITLRGRFETANAAKALNNNEEALKFYLLVATIYEDEHYTPRSLWEAAQILEGLDRRDQALKLYNEIGQKFSNSVVAPQAKERAVQLNELQN